MTNTARLITGVLLVGLGLASYLLFSQEGQPTVEADAGMNSSAKTAAVDSRSGDAHVAGGSVVGTAPSTRSTDDIAKAPPPSPAGNVAPGPGPAAVDATEAPRPETRPHRQPAPALESADVREPLDSKAGTAPRIERRREGPPHPGSNPV